MAAAGVHYAPHKIERADYTEYAVKSGAIWQRARLRVRFRFYGPLGDHFDAVVIGEGADSSDKSSNKAMTAAEKYALIQVFCISDAGADDPDAHRPEEEFPLGTPTPTVTVAGVKGAIKEAIGTELAKQWWLLEQRGAGPFSLSEAEAMKAAAVAWKDAQPPAEAEATPDDEPEPPDPATVETDPTP